MKIKLIFVLAVLFTGAAQGQYLVKSSCLPAGNQTDIKASPPYFSYNTVGVCVRWYCYSEEVKKVTYCGSWSEQSKVTSRVQTIQKSTDPLKSLGTAGNRFPIVPLDHPSMAGMPQ